ncbi:MAG: HaeII family restriction endonuclease [bacterium]|nr:HaeII family restriction endonuclease [bacterium]
MKKFMPTKSNLSKIALDLVIRKSRVHLYKPIQIAEILYHHRTERGWDLSDLESYRNISKRWRDEVSLLLVGRRSTSSQKYQDNVFEANAMPPELLVKLGETNRKGKGVVEAHIYKALEARLSSVREVEDYIRKSTPDTFDLKKLVSIFQTTPGLRRSVDKMYEILVYALFTTIVRALKAQVTLEIGNKDKEILKDFERFIKMVLGIDAKQTRLISPAALYRVGVTNASDRGLDIWANFGPAIQVKHLTLTPELMEDIADDITSDRIVIVCVDTERESIEALLKQVGWSERIQGVITINDLDDWYKLCLSKKYRANLGAKLLQDVGREFVGEFPSSKEIVPFMAKRRYDKIVTPAD